jgi:hypothetical protein
MKKHFINSLLFIAGGSVLAVLLFLGGQYFHPSRVQNVLLRQLMSKADSVEVLCTGDSLNLAIDFDAMEYNGYVMWRPAADSFEIRYTLEYLVPRLPNLQTVLIGVSSFSFLNNADDKDYLTIRQELYTNIPSFRWIRGDMKNFILGKIGLVVRKNHWRETYLYLLQTSKTFLKTCFMSSGKSHIMSYNDIQAKFINKRRRNFSVGLSGQKARDFSVPWDTLIKNPERLSAFIHQKHLERVVKNNPDYIEDSYNELSSIIAYLRLRGVRLILYSPPVFYRYTEQFNDKTIREMKQLMTDLQNKLNVEYYDFSVDSEFIYKKIYFSDDVHMNATGARLFSKKLKLSIAGKHSPH